MEKKTHGHIKLPNQIKCHKELYEEMQSLMSEINIHEYKVLCHIVYSFRSNLLKNRSNWIEIHSRTLKKYIPSFHKKNREKLIKLGLLNYDETYAVGNKCYFYYPGERLLKTIYRSFELSMFNFISKDQYTLNGKKKTGGRKKKTVKNIAFNRMNLKAMNELNQQLEAEAVSCTNVKKGQRLKIRILRNKTNLSLINDIIELDEKTGILTYIPEYEESSTGRMYEIGGGQGLTREMKNAAYSLDNVFNYDLRSSQLCILLELSSNSLSEKSKEILLAYISGDKKQEFAERLGIPINLWKKILLSTIFGGNFNQQGGIYKDIKLWVEEENSKESTEEIVSIIINSIKKEIEPFVMVRKEWLNWIELNFTSKIGETFTNAIGKKYKVLDNSHKTKRKFSAFLLQGLEAKFIREIINLSDVFGYQVYSNEHDGVVTYGEIPEEAITLAKHKTGFSSAKLEIKPFL